MLTPPDPFFDDEIRSRLQQLEPARLRARFWTILTLFSGFVIFASIAAKLSVYDIDASAAIWPAVGAMVLCGALAYWKWMPYRDRFKSEVIAILADRLHPGILFDHESGLPISAYHASRIFETCHSPDKYQSEDLFRGKAGETHFEFSEVHSQYKTTSSNGKTTQTHWHTIFQGILFVANFNKSFRGTIKVRPDVAERALGSLGRSLQRMTKGEGLVELEDPEFEEHFVVEAEDQVQARYVLSTSLMKRILEFKQKAGSDLSLSFVDSTLYVAIHSSRDRFEPRLFRSGVRAEDIRQFAADLGLLVGIIEDLNLNTRIWAVDRA